MSPGQFTQQTSRCRSAVFSLARARGTRRALSLPNPLGHYWIAKEIADSWEEIERHLSRAEISRSRPTVDVSRDRAVIPSRAIRELPDIKMATRHHGRFLVTADVSEFYKSIYTHSIAWALHGKSRAKTKKKDKALLGNRLDAFSRMASDDETSGIPVGPDTSLVLAEIVLTSIDVRIAEEIKPRAAHRYYDDFEMVFDTRADAERGLSNLQLFLLEFSLTLNSQKTTIVELPTALESPWVRELRSFELLGRSPESFTYRIHDFFDLSLHTQQRFPDQLVLPYAVGRLETVVEKQPFAWRQIEPAMLQLLRAAPVAAPNIISVLLAARRSHARVNLKAFEDCLNSVVVYGAPLSHSSELCWALWAIGAFGLKLSDEAVGAIERSHDYTARLLALYLQDKGQTGRRMDLSGWEDETADDGLLGEQWLLVYEGVRRGYLKAGRTKDLPLFAHLHQAGCAFFTDISESQQKPSNTRLFTPYDSPDPEDEQTDEDGSESLEEGEEDLSDPQDDSETSPQVKP